MRHLIVIFLVSLFVACSSQMKQNSIVLNYSDFGPQVIANEIIGMEWWQWQPHGESRPAGYDIKVVVYQNLSLDEIKKTYPVKPEQEQDYRYLKYEKAINYLQDKINENVIEDVTTKLKVTRTRLLEKFN